MSGEVEPRIAPSLRVWVVALAEILIVGLPFCVFKVLTGLLLFRMPFVAPVGGALVVLGGVDLVFNAINLVSLGSLRRRVVSLCLTDFVLRRTAWGRRYTDLGIALDILLSFGLVALVIGSGMITRLSSMALSIWNVAVVFNVFGAGVGRFLSAIQQRKEDERATTHETAPLSGIERAPAQRNNYRNF